ncbi:MAG: glycerate kinase [Actinomycetota bacterium]|nr:glycerate kinase [Actinomycetota bacterium]
MRVLVAPDKFKGTLDAHGVASSIARGIDAGLGDVDVIERPMADGGEGTASVLVEAIGGGRDETEVDGPHGAPVRAPIARLTDGRSVVEMADASGLQLVPETERDALSASSRGTGELIVAARTTAGSTVVALGGSASTDGGVGAATALGWRFLDARGRDLPPGGGALEDLARIHPPGSEGSPDQITGLRDVDNPLVGPRGAAQAFARQKGASEREVTQLERGLEVLADRIRLDVGPAVDTVPGGGAAGGMGAGLMTFFGAELVPGFEVVAVACDLARAIESVDLVITGEGALDDGSLGGKTPVAVAALARDARVPCLALCGSIELADERLSSAGFTMWASLETEVGRPQAFTDPSGSLATAARRLVERYLSA